MDGEFWCVGESVEWGKRRKGTEEGLHVTAASVAGPIGAAFSPVLGED